MENKDQQRYNFLTNRMSHNWLKLFKAFFLYPFLLLLITNGLFNLNIGYLVAFAITTITTAIINQINEKYRRNN